MRQEVKGKRYNALVREERMKSWFSPKYDVYTTVRSIELISALTGLWIRKHFLGGEKLRIPTDNGFTLLAVIRVEYEIPEQRNNSVLGKSTGNHRKKRTDAVRNRASGKLHLALFIAAIFGSLRFRTPWKKLETVHFRVPTWEQ